jgi:Raf kinase inhibitor-like YbhB/YbcL family protein
MRISSPAFEEGGNKQPPLIFEEVPATTRSLALVVDDPDAPQGTFTHWIAFNIPPTVREIRGESSAVPMEQGRNDYGQCSYGGPKPPFGEHRYFFKLYALDDKLSVSRCAPRLELEEAMIGHVIAEAEYVGRFAAHEMAGK